MSTNFIEQITSCDKYDRLHSMHCSFERDDRIKINNDFLKLRKDEIVPFLFEKLCMNKEDVNHSIIPIEDKFYFSKILWTDQTLVEKFKIPFKNVSLFSELFKIDERDAQYYFRDSWEVHNIASILDPWNEIDFYCTQAFYLGKYFPFIGHLHLDTYETFRLKCDEYVNEYDQKNQLLLIFIEFYKGKCEYMKFKSNVTLHLRDTLNNILISDILKLTLAYC